MRARKDNLERERHQYAENLLEKLLTKDRSRSPRAKDKKEKKEKMDKKDQAQAQSDASPALPGTEIAPDVLD